MEIQEHLQRHQAKNFQLQCKVSTIVWIGNLENHQTATAQNPSLHQQLFKKNLQHQLERQENQCSAGFHGYNDYS